MEVQLPPIASKKEIQNFISNIKSFNIQAQSYHVAKDIFAPTQYTVSIYSTPKDKNGQEPSIMKLKSIQSLTSFFNQSQIPIEEEIQLSILDPMISLISSGPFGLKIRFSIYIRSISLLIKFLLSNENPPYDRVNKNLTQKTIEAMLSLPVKSLFYPEIYQHPFFDFDLINYQFSSPTSICVSNDNVYTCSKDGIVTRYLKGRFPSISKGVYKIPNNFGSCSMVYLNNKLYFIGLNQKCIIINIEENTISNIFTSLFSYPSISDGYYLYSVILDKKPRVRIFDSKFERARKSIKLQMPDSISLSITMPISTNGSFINFIDNDKCHIFSVITGRYITTQKISASIQSIAYDYTYNGFICLSENGLVEVPAKSTVPPWLINYQLKNNDNIINYNEKTGFRDCILEALGMLAIQYVGGGNDIPLSMFDETCISSLMTLLTALMNQKDGLLNENAIISVLSMLQVKIRRFSQLPSEIDQKLIQFFSEKRFTFARRAASFLFLSCLSLFEKQWTKEYTKLLRLVVDDKSCSDFTFSFLTLFSFDIPDLDDQLLLSILNLMVNSTLNQRCKAVSILSTIQERLISNLPATESLFTSYVTHLMLKMTENWTASLSSSAGYSEIASSTCFTAAKVLEIQIMKNIERITLPLIVTERFFAVSMMQQIGNDSDEQSIKNQQIFNGLLFFALFFAFKGIETNNFVVCSQKVDCNHSQISIEDFDNFTKTKKFELLVNCANESNWSDKSEVINFLKETIEKVDDDDELEKRVEQLRSIQPQPLRKIKNFLITGEFNVVKHQDSAIFQLMNHSQWIPSSFSRLIFGFFLGKIEKFQDDFLCVPRDVLCRFVLSCPATLLLPLSLIRFSQVKLVESSMDFLDMQCSYDKISTYISKDQSDEFIQPLLNLKSSNERIVHRSLLAAVIGFRKSEMNEVTDEIIQKLVYCRKAVTSIKMVKLLLEIVKIFALKNDRRIFLFIVELIGGCVLKKSDIFPNAKNQRVMFQFAFEFVEFSRELLIKSDSFRSFLTSTSVLGNASEDQNKNLQSELNNNDINVIKKTAFLTIVNNTFSFPVVGSTFSVVNFHMEKVTSKITKISKNGHKITLENGNTYDIRNIFEYNVTSPHQISSEIFNDDQILKIVDFFNKFYKYFKLNRTAMELTINNSELSLKLRPLISILYFTSLRCLSSSPKFILKFTGIYSLSANIASSSDSLILLPTTSPSTDTCSVSDEDELFFIEPINDKTVFRRFWEFYTQPSTKEFSVFPIEKDGFATSPISPTTHFSVRFHFLTMCEVTLYCCFPGSKSMCEMRDSSFHNCVESYVFHELNEQALVYQTVTFSDYFDFVFDSDSQQVSMTSQDKSVTFPIFNSALFYSIYMKVKSVTFEILNNQWPLDKLNSFESFDFSLFKLCRFNHLTTRPCKSFEDSFLNELGIIIRNMCMKTIIPNMAKVKPIEASLSVSYLNVKLSNFDELFKNSNCKLKTRIKNNDDIVFNSNFDIQKMIDFFLTYVKKILSGNVVNLIWRNNSYAKPVKKGTIVYNGVLFAPGVIKVANDNIEIDIDCFVVPKEHLNRTAIELLMFFKNALIFCKETNNDGAFNEIADIMKKCQKEKIPGFTETDLKSVDTIISEVEELCST